MKNPIIGYIAVDDNEGEPLEFCTHSEYSQKILLRGGVASAFDTRPEAEAAIKATKEWAETHRVEFGDEWVDGRMYSIWAVRKVEIKQAT